MVSYTFRIGCELKFGLVFVWILSVRCMKVASRPTVLSPLLDVRMSSAAAAFGSQAAPCSFPSVTSSSITTRKELEAAAGGRPLVVVEEDNMHWNRSLLLDELGEVPVLVDNGRHDSGRHKKRMTIRRYVEEFSSDPRNLHIFQSYPHRIFERLTHVNGSEPPPALKTLKRRPISSAGFEGTATYFHNHADTWQKLLIGRKAWWLAAPETWHSEYGDPKSNPCEWLDGKSIPSSGVAPPPADFCVQHAGETLWFPDGWWHATCNLGPGITIGVGAQGFLEGAEIRTRLVARQGNASSIVNVVNDVGLQGTSAHDASEVRRAALLDSATFGNTPTLLALLDLHIGHENGVEIGGSNASTTSNEELMDSMHAAVEAGQLETLKALVQRGADLLAVRKGKGGGKTPLWLAAWNGYNDVVEYLVKPPHSAAARLSKSDRQIVLEAASISDASGAIKALLDVGVVADAGQVRTAAKAGHVGVIETLVAARVPVDKPDMFGWRPLHFASWNGHVDVVNWLLGRGAQHSVPNGGTLSAEFADEIAFPHKRLSFGWHASHLAAYSGHIGALKALVVANALLDTRNDRKQTPAELATASGHAEVAQWLASHLTATGSKQVYANILRGSGKGDIANDGDPTEL